jgi:RimJ/RimL family protein N-acetyltransferase
MLSVREIQERDVESLVQYWLTADSAFLRGMGADPDKLPEKGPLTEMLSAQLGQSYQEKQAYCIIWLSDEKAIGHSNVNKIQYGSEAYMHLHLWNTDTRQKGMGTALVRMTLPYFFENLKLETLYCEPYAHNPAPNKTLEKIGFQFVKSYVTTPGWINFEQEVNRWELSKEQFSRLTDETLEARRV